MGPDSPASGPILLARMNIELVEVLSAEGIAIDTSELGMGIDQERLVIGPSEA